MPRTYKNNRSKTKTYQDNYEPDKPKKPMGSEGSVQTGLSQKANAGLPKTAVTMLADPFADTLATPTFYPIINVDNPKVGGVYAGKANLDGGNVQQYPSSPRSGLLEVFDTSTMRTKVNYRYLPIKPEVDNDTMYRGKLLVDEMRNVMAEATSQLSSSTYTLMPIYEYCIVTDLPMGSAPYTEVEIDGVVRRCYNRIPDVLYGFSICYQLPWLEILNTISTMNSFRLKQGEMIRNGWNRTDVPNLNDLFGFLNKAAFKNKLNGICMQFSGEYVDTDFAEQVNVLSVTPSRKSEDMLSPTQEVLVNYNRPTFFRAYIKGTDGLPSGEPIFGYDTTLNTFVTTGKEQSIEMDLFEITDVITTYLSMENTVAWARSNPVGSNGVVARFNKINWLYDAVITIISKIKNVVDDLRQAFDTLARIGVVSYTKGFKPTIVKDTDAKFVRNLLVEDIYRVAFAGANTLHYNDETKRWRFFTLWNRYTGIPEYDTNSGGSFLSLSFKDIDLGEVSDDMTIGYLPTLFDNSEEPFIYMVNRRGIQARIKSQAVTMADNVVLSRLVPLPSQAGEELRVGYLDDTYKPDDYLDPITYSRVQKSYIYKALQDMLYIGAVRTDNVYDIALSHDVVAIYQIEIEDVTNEAIAYARYWAPYHGSIGAPSELGFKAALGKA